MAQDICRRADVSETSTRKALQILVKENILMAVPGPGGGYKFSRDPDKISLLSLIQAIDGPDVFEKCVMGLPDCGNAKPCPVHNSWKKVKSEMLKELKSKSLGAMMRSAQKEKSKT